MYTGQTDCTRTSVNRLAIVLVVSSTLISTSLSLCFMLCCLGHIQNTCLIHFVLLNKHKCLRFGLCKVRFRYPSGEPVTSRGRVPRWRIGECLPDMGGRTKIKYASRTNRHRSPRSQGIEVMGLLLVLRKKELLHTERRQTHNRNKAEEEDSDMQEQV